MIAIALSLHMLGAIIWVGGMFFAYMCLRPVAADMLEPEVRLQLWSSVFARFFKWVWATVIILPVTGYLMIFKNWDGFAFVTMDIHIMHGVGLLMMALFLHVYFAPYRRMNEALAANDIKEAARRLGQIRGVVAINMTLGLATGVIASAGRYW
ncbi:DUF4149 domain-containing protein [Kaarinaea lacus]